MSIDGLSYIQSQEEPNILPSNPDIEIGKSYEGMGHEPELKLHFTCEEGDLEEFNDWFKSHQNDLRCKFIKESRGKVSFLVYREAVKKLSGFKSFLSPNDQSVSLGKIYDKNTLNSLEIGTYITFRKTYDGQVIVQAEQIGLPETYVLYPKGYAYYKELDGEDFESALKLFTKLEQPKTEDEKNKDTKGSEETKQGIIQRLVSLLRGW